MMRMLSDTHHWASYVYPALMSFGDVIVCWRLLDMALAAQKAIAGGKDTPFFQGKIMQATYFTGVILPTAAAQLETCVRDGREVVEMPEEAF